MAGSLRTLLDKPDESQLRFIPTFLGEDAYQFTFRGDPCSGRSGPFSDTYTGQCGCFRIPTDLYICRIKVEAIGAGGQASGPLCWGFGAPGDGAEYTSRIFCCSTHNSNTYFDGGLWCFQVGQPCCENCGGGCKGCHTRLFTNPTGLTFEAAGGCGGTICGMCGNVNDPATTAYIRCQWGRSNDCHSDTQGYDGSCIQNFPSNYNSLKNCCSVGCCHMATLQSLMFRHDNGRGLCSKKWYIPYSAGVNSTHGGYIAQEYRGDTCCACYTLDQYWVAQRIPMGGAGAANNATYNGFPGQGGMGTWMGCTSTCSCAATGATGMIRFTLYPDTSV